MRTIAILSAALIAPWLLAFNFSGKLISYHLYGEWI